MQWLSELERIVGPDNLLSEKVDCLGYSRDMSIHEGVPEAVVFAQNTEQVSQVVSLANQEGIPVTARGAGTSVTGASLASKGGIILNLVKMNRIIEINRTDCYAVVEPGVICDDLNRELAPAHFYPPDPGSAPVATIGGMVSTNASGVRAVKYGTARDYIKAMKVVLADGRVINTGTKAPKSSAGYDLNRLFSTSEGTLGIITEITAKILPVPEYAAFAKLSFPSIVEAGAVVEEIIRKGIPISTCEILDGVSIEAVKEAMGLKIPGNVSALVFAEIDGARAAVKSQMEEMNSIFREKGGIEIEWSDDQERRAEIWSARHGLVSSLSRLHRGSRQVPITEDFGVPMSRIPETIDAIQEIGRRYGVDIATFGHIGDGNLHAVLLMDIRDKDEWETIRKISEEFIDLTLRLEGTLTAEHGIGMAKSPYIERELNGALDVMQTVKSALDPKNILNPGKMGFNDSIGYIYDRCGSRDLEGGIREESSLGESADEDVLACTQCGFCSLVCPTYSETRIETMNARGRNTLAFDLLSGRAELSEQMVNRFYQCTMCDACASSCPAGVKTSRIVQAVRKKSFASGFAPEGIRMANRSVEDNRNPFMQPRDERDECFIDPPAAPEGAEVLYWPGCVSSYQEEDVVPATAELLDRAGIAWTALGNEEGCCGYLAYVSGDMELFDELMKENLAAFKRSKVKTLVTTCPGCYRTFKDLYGKDKGGLEVLHSTEYFSRLIQEGRLRFSEGGTPLRAVYHDPCDLGRHMGVYEAPREILRSMKDVELLEFSRNRENARCCGAGGGMKGHDLNLSLDVASRHILEAAEMGADAIVSACGTCKKNFQHATVRVRKKGLLSRRIAVYDVMELMAQRMVVSSCGALDKAAREAA